MDEIAIITLRGIGLGSIYALIAMSFNVTERASGILNFAQGNMLMLGGTAAFLSASFVVGMTPGTWFLLLPLAALAIGVLMTVQGWVTLLPLGRSAEQSSWMITTMAASVVIDGLLLRLQGPDALHVVDPFPGIPMLGTTIPAVYLSTFVLALLCWLLLYLWETRTLTGLAVSALWQDPEAARSLGLKVRRLQLIAFAISGLIAGAAGFVAAPVLSLSPGSGFQFALSGFVAVVIGGLGSNAGAMIAGPLSGVVTMLAVYKIGGEFEGLTALVLLLLVLLLRPEGLFGQAAARRV